LLFTKYKKKLFFILSVLCRFVHENCRFFDVSEIAGTGGSLLLIFICFSENQNQWFFDFENLKEPITVNYFKVQITAQHWFEP